MENGSYSWPDNILKSGVLCGNADNFYLNIEFYEHGKHKSIPTNDTYYKGFKIDDDDKENLPVIHSIENRHIGRIINGNKDIEF